MKKLLILLMMTFYHMYSYANNSEDYTYSTLVNKSEFNNTIICTIQKNNHFFDCDIKNKRAKEITSFRVNHYYCPYIDINILAEDKFQIECSQDRYISNYYSYKKEQNKWILFKYEYIRGPKNPDDEGDSFITENNYLKKLKRNIENDFIQEPILLGMIKEKTYLYNKSKQIGGYLIKGNRVLILDRKKDINGNLWFQIYYQGKKDVNAWVNANSIIRLDAVN